MYAYGAPSHLELAEQIDQRYEYFYDSNPCDANYSQNGWGRLTAVRFQINMGSDGCAYQYSYNQAGRVTKQKMEWPMNQSNPPGTAIYNMNAAYEWDNEGRMTKLTYSNTLLSG